MLSGALPHGMLIVTPGTQLPGEATSGMAVEPLTSRSRCNHISSSSTRICSTPSQHRPMKFVEQPPGHCLELFGLGHPLRRHHDHAVGQLTSHVV